MENKRHKIILVDDVKANLTTGKNMLQAVYEVYPLPSAARLFEFLENVLPDLILLDIEMPEMDGYATIQKLKSDARLADIPVIFLTAKSDEESELRGLSLGAIDYVSKPFSAPLLLKRLETHLLLLSQKKELQNYSNNLEEMVRQKTREVTDLQNAILGSMTEMVEFRDSVTGRHVERTQRYLELLLGKMIEKNLYADERALWHLEFLIPSAQLHDVGKIAIHDAILNKRGPLTPQEFEIMKQHAMFGVDMIEKIEHKTTGNAFLYHAKIFAGAHHEKWNGAGYPKGLKETAIPLEGRLMAIADVYDALISARPYKEPMSAEDAKQIILEGRGSHFDPELVDIFRDLEGAFAQIASDCSDHGA